jgi:hypothetical protein
MSTKLTSLGPFESNVSHALYETFFLYFKAQYIELDRRTKCSMSQV